MARITKKSSMAGAGCLMQFFGLICFALGIVFFFTIVWPIILLPLGLWLLLAGSRKAIWYECSDCGTKLSGKRLRICPSCNSQFQG